MKVLIFSLFLSFSSFASAENTSLIGTWTLADLRCDSGAPADAEVRQQVLAMTKDAKLTFKDDGTYLFSSGDVRTPGAYEILSSTSLKMTVPQADDQYVDYAIHGDEFWMYQPLGYLRSQLCGKQSRGIQVMKKAAK